MPSATSIDLQGQTRLVIGIALILSAAASYWLSPYFLVVPLFLGIGLVRAGVTGSCPLTNGLARLPMNTQNNT